MNWTPCTDPAVADVIRWKEPIWAPPTKKRGKPDAIGEQMVTAELVELGEFLQLQVREVEQLSLIKGFEAPPAKIKSGDTIKRKKSTIERGECHRLVAA